MPALPATLNLAANTPVALTLNSALGTKANTTGEKFSLTVAQDILSDGKVVIPKGSRAIGLITFAKGNGGFGKSGKMELAFKYIEIDGKQIPLEGMFYQEGEGNTRADLPVTAATTTARTVDGIATDRAAHPARRHRKRNGFPAVRPTIPTARLRAPPAPLRSAAVIPATLATSTGMAMASGANDAQSVGKRMA